MNQPLKSTSTRLCSHREERMLRADEVPVAVAVERRHPPEPPRLHDLAEAVQRGLVVEAEHVAADDRRAAGEVAEGDRPDDALGLADDVVVHHQGVRRGALAHATRAGRGRSRRSRRGCPARCTRSLSPRDACGLGEELGVDDLLGALLHHHHGVEVGRSSSSVSPIWVSSLAQKSGRFIVVIAMSAVPCSRAVLGDLGGPLGRLDDGVVVAGDDVVPVPAAVDERLERQVEDEGALGLGAGASPSRRAASGRWPSTGRR